MNGPGFGVPRPELHPAFFPDPGDMQRVNFQRVQEWADEVHEAAQELSQKDQRYRDRADELLKIAEGLSRDQATAAEALGKERNKNEQLVALVEEMIAAREAADASTQQERERLTHELESSAEQNAGLLDQLKSVRVELAEQQNVTRVDRESAHDAARESAAQKALLETQLQDSKARAAQLEEQLEKLLVDQGQLIGQHEVLQARAEAAEAALASAAAGRTPVGNGEMAANRMRVLELEAQLGSKESRIEALSRELMDVEARLRCVCESKAMVAREADAGHCTKGELQDKEGELIGLRERLALSEAAAAGAEQELVGMLKLWETASGRLGSLGEQMQAMEHSHRAEVRLVEEELEESVAGQSELRELGKQHRAECDRLLEAHRNTQQQLSLLHEQFQALQQAQARSQQAMEVMLEGGSQQLVVAAQQQMAQTQQTAVELQSKLARVNAGLAAGSDRSDAE